ncbi:MAG: hypothetical protein QF473_17560 [Planctomycetota bacterium]|nr:hypothetical protein [Planctomycetota bacterium]
MKHQALTILIIGALTSVLAEKPKRMTEKDYLQLIIDSTQPLKFKRGDRLPLYMWSSRINSIADESEIEKLTAALNERGIAVISAWRAGNQKSIEQAIRVAKVQKKLGLRVSVDATGAVYSFCDGSEPTGHVAEDGTKFFDTSFASYRKMGCPFALGERYEPMRQKLVPFLEAYKRADVPLSLWTCDWEIDGPIEWNDAWANSKKCTRCREKIKNIDDFTEFQTELRKIRSHMQKEVFTKTIQKYYPDALIGNYGVYPHGGHRYWYDYFEKDVPGTPAETYGKARYRKWPHEFNSTGYTFSMPVVYTWWDIWTWQDFEVADYRWTYNMLLVASNAGKHTEPATPIIPFVHYNLTAPPKAGVPEDLVPMTERAYKEVLWHMLLRGHDTFAMWCPRRELAQEARLVQEVYAASMEFGEFLSKGTPVTFAVPKPKNKKDAPAVVSGMKMGNKLLVRRTDFTDSKAKVTIEVDGQRIEVSRQDGKCQILELK